MAPHILAVLIFVVMFVLIVLDKSSGSMSPLAADF